MSTKKSVPLSFTFRESEYNARCFEEQVRYLANTEQAHTFVKGSVCEFVIHGAQPAAELWHKLRSEGYQPLPDGSPLQSFSVLAGGAATLYLSKPKPIQDADLETLYAAVKVAYEKELAEEYELEVERQVEFAIAAAERKAEQAKLEAEQKIAQDVRSQLAASRAKLRTELIASGKLSPEGIAE